MNDVFLYFQLGLFHVLDWRAYDHLLFLIALTIPFSFKDFKTVFWIVTFFTLGHSFSLFFSVFGIYKPSVTIIEILIPITIIFTSVNNILKSNKIETSNFIGIIISIFFGLIHGFGFGNYFSLISSQAESKVNPLFGFAFGVEFSQLIIVLAILVINWLVVNLWSIKLSKYINIVSVIIIAFSLKIILDLLKI